MFLALLLALVLFPLQQPAQPQTSFDINTTLMRSTFKIEGPNSIGTAFILGKPMASDPNKGYYVMVTAAHVLNLMQGETATLYLRTKQGETFAKLPLPIRIRNGTQPLWVTHPAADVAVMYVNLPNTADISLISTSLLV